MSENKIRLLKGKKDTYNQITPKDEDGLYVTIDEQWMYLGDRKLCQLKEGNNINITEDNIISATTPQNESTVIDVSEMFDIGTDADVSAFLFKQDDEINKGLIKLHGFDNSNLDANLTITPVLGFGPQYDSYQTMVQTLDGATFTYYSIKINQETVNITGSIEVPFGVQTFDVNYYLRYGTNVKPSYYITTDNIMHPFELGNTPIDNFCNINTSITINGVSVNKETIKSIQFGTSYAKVTSIGDGFLSNCIGLTSIDLSGLNNVNSIGNGFLYFSGLTSIDLNPLINVTSIGGNFLYYCTELTSINLKGLGNVTSIDYNFLYNCRSLTSIDLFPLSNVSSIGSSFLNNCTGLTSIDLSGLSNVTSIGGSFLQGCTGLTSIDLKPLINVTSTYDLFLSGCSGLTSIDLKGLDNVTSIGRNFLSGCGGLILLDLGALNNVSSIEDYLLDDCIDLNGIYIGNVNWNNKTLPTSMLNGVPNVSTSTLYANSTELANIFKLKMDGKISNWSVKIST